MNRVIMEEWVYSYNPHYPCVCGSKTVSIMVRSMSTRGDEHLRKYRVECNCGRCGSFGSTDQTARTGWDETMKQR